jgi:thiamine biosynthesis protein ThiI
MRALAQITQTPKTQIHLTGRAIFLVSGGIDSPVAASMLIRKGVAPVFAYFDSYPLCDQAAEGISIDTARRVCSFHKVTDVKFYSVPHSPDLEEIVTKCPEKFACVLSRRLMFRIAEKIGLHESCVAIVTGDAIGQKASQTLQNIAATDCVMENLAVLRPLVGMNKLDIERYAKSVGTYEISIRPGVATCGVPTRNPSTNARRIMLDEVEANLDIPTMVNRAFRNARVLLI